MTVGANADAGSVECWHAIPASEVVEQLATSVEKGLKAAEAGNRLKKYGPNQLPEGEKRGAFTRFLAQFNNILVYVLLGAGFTKLMLSLWVDAAIIFAVVVLNALLGFIQEGRAEKALDSIRSMLSTEARTARDGETRLIPADQLVPGDIVLLESGDRVPADLRFVEAKNLRTEEAALTGESVPVEKTTAPVSVKATVGDRHCMAFSGTMVVSGRATGVVVATGADTELGRINQLLANVSPLETPLLHQIKKFGYTITAAIGVLSVLIFSYGHWLGHMTFVELFQAVVGIAVSLIPEGLPALITITLAIGVQRMAQRNAIVRRLPAVETLGSVSRICSDKTGTLTLMEMMVSSAITAEKAYEVTGDGYAPAGEVKGDGKRVSEAPVLKLMGRVSTLCNDAELFQEGHAWKVEGDPTEGALYPFASKLGMDRQAETAASPRIDAIPFESEHKFMATLHRSADGTKALFVKGAPEVILANCDRQQMDSGDAAPLDRERFLGESDRLAAQGERVLALAWLEKPSLKDGGLGPADLPKTLVLLGLVGLLDPPRKEAIEAVRECHGGGIRVTMITGDHKITAAAIAKMLGIGDGKTAVAGTEIEAMNEAALQQCVRDVDVFARASPEHKLRLVKAIQANGQIVAMTGDGVNDAPALKKADIGVAMGIKGTEVTKEAAGMISGRRQLRVDWGRREGGPHRLQQYRESDALPAANQRRPSAGDRGRDPVRLHLADHRPAGSLGQHGHVRRAGSCDRVRASRNRCDAAPAARGGAVDHHRLRPLADLLHRVCSARLHSRGLLHDEEFRGVRRARTNGRHQRDHDGAGLYLLNSRYLLEFFAVVEGAHGQQISAVRHPCGCDPAGHVHLRAAIRGNVWHGSCPAVGLAVASGRRVRVLPGRRGGEGRDPLVAFFALGGIRR